MQVVCNRSANFRTEKCARTRRRARDLATPNAAPIQARALPTSDVSRSARSVYKMHVERAARQYCENFARNSSVADANFARVRRQTHNFFDTKHATDLIKHSADVVSLSQRRRPKLGCAQHQKRNRFASCLQPIRKFSNGKICTNSAPSARFCNAKRCADSSERFSHVRRLAQRTIGIQNAC